MSAFFAQVEWGGYAAIGAVIVSAAGTVLAFRRGSKGDEALSLSQDADRRSKETEMVLKTQGSIIDQLQEEVARYRVELQEKASQLLTREKDLEEARKTMRDMRHELSNAKAGLAAAEKVIAALDNEISSLRRLVEDHERTIGLHEAAMAELKAQMEGRR